MNTNRKVLLIGPYPPPHGGVSVHVRNAERLLRASGWECRVITLDRSGSSRSRCLRARSAWELWRRVFEHSRDGWIAHLHTNGHNPRSWVLALLCGTAARFGGGGMLTLHSGMGPAYLGSSRLGRLLARWACGLYRPILAVNGEIRDALKALGVDREDIAVVPAFLPVAGDPDRAEEGMRPEIRAWIERRRPVLSTALFFRPEYGFDVLMDAVARVRSRHPELGCLVMGSGEEEAEARATVRRLGLDDTVFMTGDVPHSACLEAMSASDIFVRPTLSDGDAISVREAISLGVPVVASRVGCRPPNAMLFEAGNSEDLERKILETLENPKDREPFDSTPPLMEIYRQRDRKAAEPTRESGVAAVERSSPR